MNLSRKVVLAISLIFIFSLAQANLLEDLWQTVWDNIEKDFLELTYHEEFEKKEVDEVSNIIKTAQAMFKIRMAGYAARKKINEDAGVSETLSLRDAHGKAHGCTTAQLIVEKNLPGHLKRGIFAGTSYEALVRFSNGSPDVKNDKIPDGRGIAIKVLGTERLNIVGTGYTQDFLMINNSRFFTANIADYLTFQEAIIKDGSPNSFFFKQFLKELGGVIVKIEPSLYQKIREVLGGLTPALLKIIRPPEGVRIDPVNEVVSALLAAGIENPNPLVMPILGYLKEFGAQEVPAELKVVKEIQSAQYENALGSNYFSMSPYLFKDQNGILKDEVVKYKVEPVKCGKTDLSKTKDIEESNYVADLLAIDLSKGQHCFDMYVQMLPESERVNAVKWVENVVQGWNFPYTKVARLKIAKQNITSNAKIKYCENLSFNPWQAQPEHKPLGGINRVRKLALTVSSIRRHILNRTLPKSGTLHEPNSSEEYRHLK